MQTKTLVAVFISILLLTGYTRGCKKFDESCDKAEECCKNNPNPPERPNKCTDADGAVKSDKTCKTFRDSAAQWKACYLQKKCKTAEGTRSWMGKGKGK